jgi:hypothetical protein
MQQLAWLVLLAFFMLLAKYCYHSYQLLHHASISQKHMGCIIIIH